MERTSSAKDDEPSLELTLAVVAPAPGTADGFFPCVYCDRKFRRVTALGGHQNAHKQERAVTKRRRETVAAAVTGAHYFVSSVSTAWKAGWAAAAATRMPEPAGGKHGGSSSERDDEVDLSLRL